MAPSRTDAPSGGGSGPSTAAGGSGRTICRDVHTLDEAIDGLFIDRADFSRIVERLRAKKNLILQGPPGVGKTFFARRLAYALMASKSDERVEMVQFHPSYAYEDFIQGFRPNGAGFTLRNGPFHAFCEKPATATQTSSSSSTKSTAAIWARCLAS